MEKPRSVTCPNCNHHSALNERFCPNCGNRLDISDDAIREQESLNEMLHMSRSDPHDLFFERVLQGQEQIQRSPLQTRAFNDTEMNNFRYASSFLRFAAYIFDEVILLFLALWITNFIFPFPIASDLDVNQLTSSQISEIRQNISIYFSMLLLTKTLFGLGYFYGLESTRFGQTLGMFLCRIRIIDYRLNRAPSKQQVLVIAMSKSMEFMLLIDLLSARKARNAERNANNDQGYISNILRLSQRMARIAVIRV